MANIDARLLNGIRQGRLGDATGPLLFLANLALALIVFKEGFLTLFEAWQLAEYSHGPLIPMLSGLLFLRQLKTVPVQEGPVHDRWPGVLVIGLAVAFALFGKVTNISEVVAYSIIVWVAGVLLTSFGWSTGRHFWPGVLHLVFMLPLPGVLYWKVSIFLRGFASEIGVGMVSAMGIPVYLDGNIIDLGVYQLHVADACSGLRYLFPIMSFSYIFATLYRGPWWHKAVLLLSAAPIAVMMNSVRIGIIGVMVDSYGIEHAIGLSHLLEGWVIFITCVVMLFALAKLMLMLQRGNDMTLGEALDLDTRGLGPQVARLRHLRASPAMAGATALLAAVALLWTVSPGREVPSIEREPLALFPQDLGDWVQVGNTRLEPEIEAALGADDYLSSRYARGDDDMSVEVFVAWYRDQTRNGIHPPEVCLPAGGWEIAELTRPDLGPTIGLDEPLPLNRLVIEKGHSRRLVYYWFEQYGGRTALDFTAKMTLLIDTARYGRSDGALVRLTTPIVGTGGIAAAEDRLNDMLGATMRVIDRHVPRHAG
ncbi:MAG: VPLPA-CTERM-specific exosortase XrtD [Paracoccaceae bacterium]